MSSATSFSLDSVGVSFGSLKALHEVDLEIASGELVAIVGPSGAGKSTLLSLLNGSVLASAGEVRANDRNIRELSSAELRNLRCQTSVVYQGLNLIPGVRVIHNVLLGRIGQWSLIRSLKEFFSPSKKCCEEIYSILQRVGIEEKLFIRTASLSGGEKQRVAIARALFQHPSVILADEPVSSVDPARAEDTVSLFVDLARERKFTLLMSLHNVRLARKYFPRIVALRAGQVVFDKPTSEISDEEMKMLYSLEQDDEKL